MRDIRDRVVGRQLVNMRVVSFLLILLLSQDIPESSAFNPHNHYPSWNHYERRTTEHLHPTRVQIRTTTTTASAPHLLRTNCRRDGLRLLGTHDATMEVKSQSSPTTPSYTVGIVGTGAIAFATAALLAEAGHHPMLWSPSGSSTLAFFSQTNSAAGHSSKMTTATISVERNTNKKMILEETPNEGKQGGETLSPRIARTAQELVEENEILLFALPANGHKRVFDELAPYIRRGQSIIISSHASFGALYLSRLIRDRLGRRQPQVDVNEDSIFPPITAWGTTVCTARKLSESSVRINTVRTAVDLCTIPESASKTSQQLCQQLFPQIQTFRPRKGILAISLSNLNPQNHLGIALGNISRMEKGERWYQSEHITPAIGRLLESLDEERLAIADALNLETKTIFDHFSLSFHVPATTSISDMNQEIHKAGNDVYGPDTADSRYVTEDIPFGLVPTIVLGQLTNRHAILHESGVQLMSAMYGRDFVSENDLLPALQLERYSLHDLQEAALTGELTTTQSDVDTREILYAAFEQQQA